MNKVLIADNVSDAVFKVFDENNSSNTLKTASETLSAISTLFTF